MTDYVTEAAGRIVRLEARVHELEKEKEVMLLKQKVEQYRNAYDDLYNSMSLQEKCDFVKRSRR